MDNQKEKQESSKKAEFEHLMCYAQTEEETENTFDCDSTLESDYEESTKYEGINYVQAYTIEEEFIRESMKSARSRGYLDGLYDRTLKIRYDEKYIVARKMLIDDKPFEEIEKYTDLTKEELEKLNELVLAYYKEN